MITPKHRAELKGLANSLSAAFQIGKGGVSDAQTAQIDDYLRVHELVKFSVLENSLYSAREAAEEIAEKIGADVVQVIGSKAVLYKRNPKDPVIKLKNK
jgi:RNA-binding protein